MILFFRLFHNDPFFAFFAITFISQEIQYAEIRIYFFFKLQIYPLFRNFLLTREKKNLIYSIPYKWHASIFYILKKLSFYWMTHRRLWFRFLDWMIFVGFESDSLVLDRWTFPSDGQTFSVMDTLLPQIHPCTKNTTEKIKCFNMFPCMLAVMKRVVS